MQMSKPIIIGVAVLVLAVLAGIGIMASMNNDDTASTTTPSTSQMDQNMNEESAQPENRTIAAIATETESLSTLVAAVQASGLVDTLNNTDEQYTVFAPNNAAFDKLPEGTVDTLLQEENRDQLTTVLTYHVVPSVAMSSDLSDGQQITTAQGDQLTVEIENDMVYIVDAMGGRAQVVTADVEASNGVVHIIDSVLMPQS